MLETEFINAVLSNPINATVFERLEELQVSDPWLVSGALFQTVWNRRTGRQPGYGIADYDIAYLDAADLSWEAENSVIKRADRLFGDLSAKIEIRNQARVHLWYRDKFDRPYPPLTASTDAIDRYLAVASMVGLTPEGRARFRLYAPQGLADVGKLSLRPNPSDNFSQRAYEQKVRRWTALWPELIPGPAVHPGT